MRNVLVVLSGPSGVGKGTIANLLTKKNKNISLSISCTTRKPRDGEVNGVCFTDTNQSHYRVYHKLEISVVKVFYHIPSAR